MEGVDYAWDRPDLAQLWAAGVRFVCRYLAYLPNGKVLTRTELGALHGKGFGVALNWEQAAGDMLRGKATGEAHAREALRQANALGAPSWVPVYFSCDVDVTSAGQMAAVAAYLDGCATVLGRGRVGVYGEHDVIEALVPAHAAWGWQTYAWSGGRVSGRAHVYQYRNGVRLAGADCDRNRSLQPSFGAWFPGAQPAASDDSGRAPTMMIGQVVGQPAVYVTWDGRTRQHLSGEQADTLAPLSAAGYRGVQFPTEADLTAVMGPVAAPELATVRAQLAELAARPGGAVTLTAEDRAEIIAGLAMAFGPIAQEAAEAAVRHVLGGLDGAVPPDAGA